MSESEAELLLSQQFSESAERVSEVGDGPQEGGGVPGQAV